MNRIGETEGTQKCCLHNKSHEFPRISSDCNRAHRPHVGAAKVPLSYYWTSSHIGIIWINRNVKQMTHPQGGRRLFPQAIATQLTDRNLSAWSLPSIWPVIRRLAWEMIDHFPGKYHSCERVSYKLGWAGKTHHPHISPPSPDRSSSWQPKQKCFADILHVEGWQS